METDRVQGWILWSLTAPAFVCAILFLVRYYQAYDQLWWSAYTPWPGELRALMAPFAQCAVWTLLVYPVLAVVALATAAVLYSSTYPLINPYMGSMLGLRAFIAAHANRESHRTYAGKPERGKPQNSVCLPNR